MDTGQGMYLEHRGVDIAVHAHQIDKHTWVPRTVLFEPTIGGTRELEASPHPGYASEQEALEAGVRMALETIDGMHVTAPASKERV